MKKETLLKRVKADPRICGGQACIRGTRIPVAVVLDALAEGLDTAAILEHYPSLRAADVLAAVAYAAELARENVWRIAAS